MWVLMKCCSHALGEGDVLFKNLESHSWTVCEDAISLWSKEPKGITCLKTSVNRYEKRMTLYLSYVTFMNRSPICEHKPHLACSATDWLHWLWRFDFSHALEMKCQIWKSLLVGFRKTTIVYPSICHGFRTCP